MKIGIIGSGNVGKAIAGHLCKLGHQVLIANSRGPETLKEAASSTGATASTVEDAARGNDLVVIAIPAKGISQLRNGLFSEATGVIVDAGNYYPSRDGNIQPIDDGLADSEWVARVLGCNVVKAFNNIVAESLASSARPSGSPDRICLSVAGDDLQSKKLILELIDAVGFDAIDSGTLSESWRQQPGTPAYCRDLPKDGLRAALGQAEHELISAYRAEADETARPYFNL